MYPFLGFFMNPFLRRLRYFMGVNIWRLPYILRWVGAGGRNNIRKKVFDDRLWYKTFLKTEWIFYFYSCLAEFVPAKNASVDPIGPSVKCYTVTLILYFSHAGKPEPKLKIKTQKSRKVWRFPKKRKTLLIVPPRANRFLVLLTIPLCIPSWGSLWTPSCAV